MGPDSVITEAMLEHQLDLLRLEAGVRSKVLASLNALQRDLVARLSGRKELTEFGKARINSLLRETNDAIESYYARMQAEMDVTLQGVAEITSQHVADTLETALSIDLTAGLPPATFVERAASNTMIMGAPSSEWWARQSQDTAFRFSNTVRQGIIAGDTNGEIVGRIIKDGILDTSRRNARSLVHTSIQSVANSARQETFKRNSDVVEGTRHVSTFDGHTSDICIAYGSDGADGDGAEWDLDGDPMEGTTLPYDGGVPRHWGCRSVEVPITKSFKELGLDVEEPPPGEQASGEGPTSMNFEEWLGTRTEDQQDEQLGVGRAELWRNGDITLTQLLDLKGNPLTLDELKEKYA